MQIFLFFLSIFLPTLNGVWAEDNSPVMKIGVEMTDYSPYYYLDEKLYFQGAAREIIDLFSSQAQQPIEYHPMPVTRLFKELVKGSIDLKFPDNPLWGASHRAKIKVSFSQTVLIARESVLVMINTKGTNTQQVLDTKIQDVGTITGFSTPSFLKALVNKEFESVDANEVEQLIHMLANGRIQALYFNESVAQQITKVLYPNKRLIAHPDYPVVDEGYMLSSIKYPELIEAFDQFLVSHAEQVAEIRQRHGLR